MAIYHIRQGCGTVQEYRRLFPTDSPRRGVAWPLQGVTSPHGTSGSRTGSSNCCMSIGAVMKHDVVLLLLLLLLLDRRSYDVIVCASSELMVSSRGLMMMMLMMMMVFRESSS